MPTHADKIKGKLSEIEKLRSEAITQRANAYHEKALAYIEEHYFEFSQGKRKFLLFPVTDAAWRVDEKTVEDIALDVATKVMTMLIDDGYYVNWETVSNTRRLQIFLDKHEQEKSKVTYREK